MGPGAKDGPSLPLIIVDRSADPSKSSNPATGSGKSMVAGKHFPVPGGHGQEAGGGINASWSTVMRPASSDRVVNPLHASSGEYDRRTSLNTAEGSWAESWPLHCCVIHVAMIRRQAQSPGIDIPHDRYQRSVSLYLIIYRHACRRKERKPSGTFLTIFKKSVRPGLNYVRANFAKLRSKPAGRYLFPCHAS